jgi:acyl carrier protein
MFSWSTLQDINCQDFILIMKSKREPYDGESPKVLPSEQAPYNRATTNLVNSPNILTNDNLRKLVLEIFASKLGLELNDISETRSLEDIGVDSLTSLSIARRLREEIGIYFGSDLLFGSKTIKDVQDKLRFATRLYFTLWAKSGGEIQSTQSSLPRITLSEPLFAVMEVASSASLIDYNTITRCLDMARTMHEDAQTTFAVAEGMKLSVSLDIHGGRHSLRLHFF